MMKKIPDEENGKITTSATCTHGVFYCQISPKVYYHPDSEQLLFVDDGDLVAEHNYLQMHLAARFTALQKIEELNQLDHRQRWRSHTYKQQLTKAYQEYYDCCDKLQQLLSPLPVPKANTNDDASEQHDELTVKFSSMPIVELIEMKKSGGYKYTYVRSDKIKNHVRRYQLHDKDKQSAQHSFIEKEHYVDEKTGQSRSRHKINHEKLRQQLTTVKVSSHSDFTLLEERQGAWGQWAKDLNKSLEHSPYQGEHFAFDWKAQFMRWSYGATGQQTSNFGDIEHGKFDANFKASGNASLHANLSLAEAKTEATYHIPDKHGLRVCYPSVAKNGELVTFGTLRFDLTLSLSGNVGASFALQADVNIDGDAIKGVMPKHRPDLKKLGKDKNIAEAAQDQGGVMQAELFFGARAGAQLAGKMLWCNPDENPTGFNVLGSLAVDLEGLAGVGFSGMLAITYYQGHIRMVVRGGLCWGIGGHGSAAFDIDQDKIMTEFMPCLGHMLRDLDYQKLTQIIAEDAFYAICALPLLLIMEADKVIEQLIWKSIDDLIDNLNRSWNEKEKRDRIMDKVLDSKGRYFRFCPPETKGAAISALLQDHLWESIFPHTDRKRAILHILRWAQSKQDFRNILQFLNQVPNNNKQDWQANYQQIRQFLHDGEEVQTLVNPGDIFNIVNNDPIRYRVSHYSQILDKLYEKLPDKPGYWANTRAPFREFITAFAVESGPELINTL